MRSPTFKSVDICVNPNANSSNPTRYPPSTINSHTDCFLLLLLLLLSSSVSCWLVVFTSWFNICSNNLKVADWNWEYLTLLLLLPFSRCCSSTAPLFRKRSNKSECCLIWTIWLILLGGSTKGIARNFSRDISSNCLCPSRSTWAVVELRWNSTIVPREGW